MIYELRIYRFYERQKGVFLREFKKAKRSMAQYGVTFVAAWENPNRDDEFIWLRPTIRRREVRIMKSLTYSTIRQASLVTPEENRSRLHPA